jgi:transcriptional regulator with XRE-family HTH domain
MNINTLKMLMKIRSMNQSDIAKIAQVSRQSVSLWFASGSDFQNIQVLHLLRLSQALGISMDEFASPIPVFNDPDKCRSLSAEFLWDRLYPDLHAFFIALARRKYQAVARLAECRGLYESARVSGNIVWKEYPKYCRYIHPAKRKECDYIWKLHANRI